MHFLDFYKNNKKLKKILKNFPYIPLCFHGSISIEDESRKTKETAAQGDDLDLQLVNLLTSLPEKDVQRVKDFVAGLKAAHEE